MLVFIYLKVGPIYGRKTMKGYLAQKYKVNICQKRVGNALKTVAPHYLARPQTDTTHQTHALPYRGDYFGHKLHIDQNKKGEMYDVVHVSWALPLYHERGNNVQEKQ